MLLKMAPLIRDPWVFGCASTHHLSTGNKRRRLLDTAYGAGFRQFDVAPAYENGLIERAVGAFAAAVRRKVKVHTKVGIPIWIYPAWTEGIFPAAQAVDVVFGNHRGVYGERCFLWTPSSIALGTRPHGSVASSPTVIICTSRCRPSLPRNGPKSPVKWTLFAAGIDSVFGTSRVRRLWRRSRPQARKSPRSSAPLPTGSQPSQQNGHNRLLIHSLPR